MLTFHPFPVPRRADLTLQGKPRQPQVLAQPRTSLTNNIDGLEEMDGCAVTSPCVSAEQQVSLKNIAWILKGRVWRGSGEEQV